MKLTKRHREAKNNNRVIGPPSYENWKAYEHWKAANNDETFLITHESHLYTDVSVPGNIEDKLGPYKILDVHADKSIAGVPRPALILRIIHHTRNVELSETNFDRTDDRQYHGDRIEDDVAALLSLTMGVRFKAGETTRIFVPDDDRMGRPYYRKDNRFPTIFPQTHGYKIPRAIEKQALPNASELNSFPLLNPKAATALIDAAKMYQDALWISESETKLAWVLFVSAVETAANHWCESKETPVQRMLGFKPELEKLLRKYGGTKLLEDVAVLIADFMGSTAKFRDFIWEFLPDPPENRPRVAYRLSWDKKDMKKTMNKVYNYRSRALHNGIPFPDPMCSWPEPIGIAGYLSEVPSKLAMRCRGGTWRKEDIPLLLHTFEYIVRNALLNWWSKIVTDSR